MAILTKDQLLGATAPAQETVNITALGGDVIVRGMTGKERDAFEASLVEGRGKKRDVNTKNLRAKLVAYCCVNEKGERLFTDADADRLGDVRADVLDKLFSVAQKLSGITEEDADDLGKPSAPTAVSGSSSSVSPASSV